MQTIVCVPVTHGRMCAGVTRCRCVCILPVRQSTYRQTSLLSYLPLQYVSDHLLSLLSNLPSHSSPPQLMPVLLPRVRVWVLAHTHHVAEPLDRACSTTTGRRARSSTTSNVLDACVCALVCVCTSRKSMACGVSVHGRRAWSRGPE